MNIPKLSPKHTAREQQTDKVHENNASNVSIFVTLFRYNSIKQNAITP